MSNFDILSGEAQPNETKQPIKPVQSINFQSAIKRNLFIICQQNPKIFPSDFFTVKQHSNFFSIRNRHINAITMANSSNDDKIIGNNSSLTQRDQKREIVIDPQKEIEEDNELLEMMRDKSIWKDHKEKNQHSIAKLKIGKSSPTFFEMIPEENDPEKENENEKENEAAKIKESEKAKRFFKIKLEKNREHFPFFNLRPNEKMGVRDVNAALSDVYRAKNLLSKHGEIKSANMESENCTERSIESPSTCELTNDPFPAVDTLPPVVTSLKAVNQKKSCNSVYKNLVQIFQTADGFKEDPVIKRKLNSIFQNLMDIKVVLNQKVNITRLKPLPFQLRNRNLRMPVVKIIQKTEKE